MARNEDRWRDEGRDWREEDRWRGEGHGYGTGDRGEDRGRWSRGERERNDHNYGDFGRSDYERGSSQWQGGRETYPHYGSRDFGGRDPGSAPAGYGSGYGGRLGSSGYGGYGGAGYPREDRIGCDRAYGPDSGGGSAGGGYGVGDRHRDDYGRQSGRDSGRGFLERAGDEIASWFGDDDAERRRHEDERRADSHRGRGPRGYTRPDDRIRDDLNDRLTDDPYIDASDIDIAVANGEVTLSGAVDHRSVRRRAEDLAESISGVTHVQNNLRVRQGTGRNPGQNTGQAPGLGGGNTGAGASAIADLGGVGRGGAATATTGSTGALTTDAGAGTVTRTAGR